jgi:hypothetical protein
MTERHGPIVKRAERTFTASPTNLEQAGWLDVPVGNPAPRTGRLQH